MVKLLSSVNFCSATALQDATVPDVRSLIKSAIPVIQAKFGDLRDRHQTCRCRIENRSDGRIDLYPPRWLNSTMNDILWAELDSNIWVCEKRIKDYYSVASFGVLSSSSLTGDASKRIVVDLDMPTSGQLQVAAKAILVGLEKTDLGRNSLQPKNFVVSGVNDARYAVNLQLAIIRDYINQYKEIGLEKNIGDFNVYVVDKAFKPFRLECNQGVQDMQQLASMDDGLISYGLNLQLSTLPFYSYEPKVMIHFCKEFPPFQKGEKVANSIIGINCHKADESQNRDMLMRNLKACGPETFAFFGVQSNLLANSWADRYYYSPNFEDFRESALNMLVKYCAVRWPDSQQIMFIKN